MSKNYTPRFGYKPNPAATFRFVRNLRIPHISTHAPHLLETNAERDACPILDLYAVDPNYKRGAQAIGDCVSWGFSLGASIVLAGQVVRGEAEWPGAWISENATYGLRAEVDPRNFANYQDGWYGSGAAEAYTKYGAIPSLDWSKETGNPDHDIRQYSGDRAKEWGKYGCGGQGDNGKLDSIAKKYPIREVSMITTLESAEAVMDRGCPIPICSDMGFGQMQRNEEGIVRPSGSWAHCMLDGLKLWRKGRRLWSIHQSWGNSCSGPQPYIEEIVKQYYTTIRKAMRWTVTAMKDIAAKVINSIGQYTWLVEDEPFLRILKQQDSYSLSGAEGYNLPIWDLDNF